MSNIIVLAFSPRNILRCLLKNGLQRGWGGGGSRAPQDPPRYALKLEVTEESDFMLRLSAVFLAGFTLDFISILCSKFKINHF